MKPEWVIKLFTCSLLGGVSLLLLNGLRDDSLLVCTRQSDRRIDCMASQINFLGEQHDGLEIVNIRKASLEFRHQSNGRLSSVLRVLLMTVQGEKIPLSFGYASSESQPEPAEIVAQVNQFLQSHKSRLEISVIYIPRIFLILAIVPLGLLLVVIKSKIEFKK
jgi:hypothetical protein